MGKRSDVPTAPLPIAAVAVFGLVQQMATELATVPLRRPWVGPFGIAENVAQSLTRNVMRTFMGYSSSLPIEEFRSLEVAIDDLCAVVLPPFIRQRGVQIADDEVGGVPGTWYRPREVDGTILYLHGGGYIGTSPRMYGAFTAWLAMESRCEVFVADYRLAPEFPFPCSLHDAIAVYEALLATGRSPSQVFVAGDSGGGGLANSLLVDGRSRHLPRPAGLLLFSPEVDLVLDEPSVAENAGRDILPWNVPVAPYLHGVDPRSGLVSAVYADLHRYPPTFVTFGDDEIFRDPIRRFVEHLRAANVATEVIEEPDMFHVFPFLMPWAGASRRVFRAAGTFVTERLAPTAAALG